MINENRAELVSLPSVDLVAENKELQYIRDKIKELKDKYDSMTLARDIRSLQDSSRIQSLKPELRDAFLKELQRRKLIKQIVDGEFF